MNLAVFLSVLLAVCAIGYLLLGIRTTTSIQQAGGMPLGIGMIVIGVWVFGGAIELTAQTFEAFSVGRMGHWLGTALLPVLFMICFRQYTGYKTPTRLIVASLIIPVCSVLVAATNSSHELMWSGPVVNEFGDFLTRPKFWGPWFVYVHAPYGYLMISVSILTLLMHSSAVAPTHRSVLFMLAGSAIAPIVAIGAYDLGVGANTATTVQLVFAAMLPIYSWLLLGEKIIEFSPLAYETVFQNMQDPVIVIDDQRRIIGLNHGAEALLNIKEKDALRESLDSVFGADVPEVFMALQSGLPQKIMTSTGRFLHLQVSPISTNDAIARSGRVLMFRDVSDVERAQREVQNSEKLLRTLIDHSVNGILRFRWVSTDNGERTLRCIFSNSAAANFLHKQVGELIDIKGEDLIGLAASGLEKVQVNLLIEQFTGTTSRGEVMDVETRVQGGGRNEWLRVIAEPVGEDMAITLIDITDRKAKEHQMESIASSDPLTGVLNRRGFEREASNRLLESEDDASGALLFIDLNDFKKINDVHGHEMGDQLLTIAAQRLRTSLRSCDIIGRPGGDEFVALVPDVSLELAEKLAKRLTDSLEQPYLIGNSKLTCGASIGLAVYPTTANTLTGLMRAADQAMYRAKARCRGVTSIKRADLLEKAV